MRYMYICRFPQLQSLTEDPHTVLLYPGRAAQNLEDLVTETGSKYTNTNLIVLDGTWSQAKGIYLNTEWLHSIKQVHSF